MKNRYLKPSFGNRPKRFYWDRIAFLGLSFIASFVGSPLYIWHLGLLPSDVVLFLVFFTVSGLSITLGYHRLFCHRAFDAHWSVRLATLIFGAAALEGSVILWCRDHRHHHQFTDKAPDPYNRIRGFWYAHIGWALQRPEQSVEANIADLRQDRLVVWQDRYFFLIGPLAAYVLPCLIGWAWNGGHGALGGFLVAGVTRVVLTQQVTFCVNSVCHTFGRQPYTSRCTARDNFLVALFTFGEGYHNFHHRFPGDYRNGVKSWHFDPTKWCIWLLSRIGLTCRLNRVPTGTIVKTEREELQRKIAAGNSRPTSPP
jgi:stearoyl-CoA desaturase (delta-9 desaturase)